MHKTQMHNNKNMLQSHSDSKTISTKEYERMTNHIQTLLSEKKAHLKKIARLEATLTQFEQNQAAQDTFVANEITEEYIATARAHADAALVIANEAKISADKMLATAKEELSLATNAAARITANAEHILNTAKDNAVVYLEHARIKSALILETAEARRDNIELIESNHSS
jgi:hypothetical protein